LPDLAALLVESLLIPAVRSLVPAAFSSGGMIALTAPAAAPAITLTAVFFSVLVAPLARLEPRFLRDAARVRPDPLAPFFEPLDLDDDECLLLFFVGILSP
jgi:hypothetical protein